MVFFIVITLKYAHVYPFRIVMKVLAFIPSKSGVYLFKGKGTFPPLSSGWVICIYILNVALETGN